MINDDSETSEKRYTLRPTSTPLPSKGKAENESQSSLPKAGFPSKAGSLLAGKPKLSHFAGGSENTKVKSFPPTTKIGNGVVRAANEDDDLYDPYSDYHDGTLKAAEFEEDPWR